MYVDTCFTKFRTHDVPPLFYISPFRVPSLDVGRASRLFECLSCAKFRILLTRLELRECRTLILFIGVKASSHSSSLSAVPATRVGTRTYNLVPILTILRFPSSHTRRSIPPTTRRMSSPSARWGRTVSPSDERDFLAVQSAHQTASRRCSDDQP